MPGDPRVELGVLTTEGVNEATVELDQMRPLEIARVMNAEDALVPAAVERELSKVARAIDLIAQRIREGGRLIYIGAGTSGRLGVLDASECPPTFGTPPELVLGIIAGGDRALRHSVEAVEDSPEEGRADLRRVGLNPRDAVVGIAASGRTPYVLGAVEYARSVGALTVGLACNRNTPLEERVDVMISPVVGPEVLSGSTRLKAGTAEKLVLNMLSTGVMVLLGKTYGNLMVDLRVSNSKLRERAIRIVRTMTGLNAEEAAALLERSGGETKVAILAGLAGIEPEEARMRLAAAGGNVRVAIGGGRG